MAQRLVSITAALVVAGLVIGPVAAVLWRGGGFAALSAADLAALRFTVWQAFWSATLSVCLAIPVARALSRRTFWGRSALISVMGAPFILPVIVAILGLLAVFGGNGVVNAVLGPLGIPKLDIYGAQGVILAHVFFNLPLAVRLIVQGWLQIPSERFRVAASLDAPVFWLLEWPMLRRIAPSAFAVIFVICLGSFAVALTLGGGPRATTVELAIYQAFKFDFDLSKAASLAVVQLCLGLSAGTVALLLSRGDMLGAGLDRVVQRWDGNRLLDALWISTASLFLLAPLCAILVAGLPGMFDLPPSIWPAALRSLLIALGAVALTMTLALPLATKAGEAASLLGISVSGLVLGTGLFLIVQPFVRPSSVALPITMLVNVLMALPFVLRILRPSVQSAKEDFGRLAESLGLEGWALWRIAYLPRLRRPMGFAAGLTGALAMGDLGVITLFSRPGEGTLPLMMYDLMGRYQMEAAYGAALLLVALSVGLFWVFDKGGRVNADA
ncbi:thiamine/thiamine pyrophosphate ABC transporter permease ThiP [Octadecabacter sp. 1_MG-2023]|uniref:thiamine/thiamine pyrophosphate ABC transporter permease ThiP n=1 Tax=unclassified Octadecabacter TaxID=196158 RepID=UPI001C087D56|nr:thiamine/thiamine pyrophosphate ABC transporter permease ThiP [Octadecabacter sp. 1_MG-2023]MBU2992211.1 thiamine/thiamine pyrophosphate ABC transporter permease ThiP [Octadecabacter sp. B2R22]MDO6735033.1 thiamine/thiamine pyrophosphate ABC transporter permease ThiP [Octadecabacter sp. 1_MG-2023]